MLWVESLQLWDQRGFTYMYVDGLITSLGLGVVIHNVAEIIVSWLWGGGV